MPTTQKERAVISKSRSKSNPFKVTYIAKNGEPLAPSENLASHKNCLKNICAMGNLWVDGGGDFLTNPMERYIVVLDKTGKEDRHYRLYLDGNIEV